MPNKKHLPTTPEQRNLARKWGRMNGYSGEKGGGGWINSKDGKQICHGWGQFWHKFHFSIREWSYREHELQRCKCKG